MYDVNNSDLKDTDLASLNTLLLQQCTFQLYTHIWFELQAIYQVTVEKGEIFVCVYTSL